MAAPLLALVVAAVAAMVLVPATAASARGLGHVGVGHVGAVHRAGVVGDTHRVYRSGAVVYGTQTNTSSGTTTSDDGSTTTTDDSTTTDSTTVSGGSVSVYRAGAAYGSSRVGRGVHPVVPVHPVHRGLR